MKGSKLLRAALVLAAASSAFAVPAPAQERAPARQDDEGDEKKEPPPGEPEKKDPPADPPPAPDAGGAEPAKPPARELDTTSPEAQALEALLHVEPRYAKDGTVELIYEFDSDGELQDWQNQGFDLAETRGGDLVLGAGSQGQGLAQHVLTMQGAYEVIVTCRVDWLSGRSDLVFLLGKGGGRYGNQFVEKKSGGWKPLTRVEPARERFGGGREVTLRYLVDGDDITVWINGVQMGTSNKLKGKLAGRFGLWMTDLRLAIHQITIKGRIDASKL